MAESDDEVVTAELVDGDQLGIGALASALLGTPMPEGFGAIFDATLSMMDGAADRSEAAQAQADRIETYCRQAAENSAYLRALVERAVAGSTNPVVRKIIGL